MTSPSLKNVVAILLATIAALFARAWLQIRLVGNGMHSPLAGDLAYLVVLPLLALLILPVLVRDRSFVRGQFRACDLTWRIVLLAAGAGVFLRLAWHAHIVAGVAFGYYATQPAATVNAPILTFDCPPTRLVALTIVVYSLFIPVVEELTHRAYVQSYFERFGSIVGIALSTAVFTIFHKAPGWDFVAICGVVLGTMYWITRSLWAPVITHAVVNFLPQVTLRCLDVQWSPASDTTPVLQPGLAFASLALVSGLLLVASVAALRLCRGPDGPGAPRPTRRRPPVR